MTTNDDHLKRYEAVLRLHEEMAKRGIAPPEPAPARTPMTPQHCRFAGLDFLVNTGVFAPNEGNAAIVEHAVNYSRDFISPVVVDVGTGCGAFAIAYAVRRADAVVYAIDNADAAVACAHENVARLETANVTVLQGSLLEPLLERGVRVDVVMANMPWMPATIADVVDAAGTGQWRGPRDAVVGRGRDGLDVVRELVRSSTALLNPRGVMILAMDRWQVAEFEAEFSRDYEITRGETGMFVILRAAV
jgi:release factor glutamine methyltransferase